MDQEKARKILMMMEVGKSYREGWLLQKGCTTIDLAEWTEAGWLIKYEKKLNDPSSETEYILTKEGRKIGWTDR